MPKTVLIICDALRDDIARQQMGYLEHLVEQKQASRYTAISELPTLSRPLYETIHTGVPVHEHGITSNITVRRSSTPNIFQLARDNGKTTAAAAYCWYSELYIRAPYDIVQDREIDDESQLIQHGRFYREEDYPDIELFATAGLLVMRHQPDYLLVHPMGCDTVGHEHGGTSSQYKNQVVLQDQIMANFIPLLITLGYAVLVTGDHGMSDDKNHNGVLPDVRHVPLYYIGGRNLGDTGSTVSQLQIAPTICSLLGIPPAPTMKGAVIE